MVKSFIFQSIVLFIWLTTTIATILAIIVPSLEFQRIAFAQHIYWVLRLFCHQIPSRCFWIWGSNMGLCSRCFSLDTSFSLCIIKHFLVIRHSLFNSLRLYGEYNFIQSPASAIGGQTNLKSHLALLSLIFISLFCPAFSFMFFLYFL